MRVLDDPGGLGLGLLAHLGDDRRALLAGLLADLGRLVTRVGDLGLELLLGRVGLGFGLVEVGELLRIASWRAVIARLIGGMTYLASRQNISANAASSTKNVAFGTRKLLFAIGTS